MTSVRYARQLLLMLAAVSAMLLGACYDDGLITPPEENDGDSCCATLSVAVTSSTANGPLGGVTVALRKGMDVVSTKQTNDAGVATFTDVCNAEYNIRLTKDGYSVAEKGDIFITRCDTTRVEIAMRATTTTNPDSCCTSILRIIPTNHQGNPISGAQVKLTGPNGYQRIVESTLDGATFRELCRGAYAIRIAREGFKVHESVVEVGCGTEATERRGLVGLHQPNDSCCQARLVVGARDAATGELLNGAVVKLWKGGQLYRTLTINGRAVVFEELCEGGYGISITREGYRGVEDDVRVNCNSVGELWKNLERIVTDSCCNNLATIRVLDAVTRRPIADALVKLRRNSAILESARTNGDGVARFDGMCVGEYSVIIEREGYNPTDPRFNVVCGQGAEITVTMQPKAVNPPDSCRTASLSLTVFDGARDAEIGLAGVTVVIKYGGAIVATGMTNREGVYVRGELSGHRTYEVVLERDGYTRMAFPLQFGECTTIRKAVRLIPQ